MSESPEVSDSDHSDQMSSREATPGGEGDDYDGPIGYGERRGTILHQLQRSCSLDMLSDEHKFDEDKQRAKVH